MTTRAVQFTMALQTCKKKRQTRLRPWDLFRENLLRMEVEEILQEVRALKGADSASHPNIEKFARSLKDVLFNIPPTSSSVPPYHCGLFEARPHYFSGATLSTHREVPLDLVPPNRIDLIASYLLHVFVDESSYTWDVSVTMPSKCFVAKDYLDGRYSQKRFLYLGALGRAIMQKTENKKV